MVIQLTSICESKILEDAAVLQVDEIAGRWCSKDLVEVIEWSHNKDKQRRFEMALNLDDQGGIWVRATGRHTNGCNASQLPDGVTQETRSESDKKAMEAAKMYTGPGAVKEHRERHGYPRHDPRGPPRPVARPLESTHPVPPEGPQAPRTPGARTPGVDPRPRTPETPPPEPTEQPSLRKVTATQMPPPVVQAAVRQGSDQSTTASSARSSDVPEVETKQKGNKVDWKLTEEVSSGSDSSQDAEDVPKQASKGASPKKDASSPTAVRIDDGSCLQTPAAPQKASSFEWPANILGIVHAMIHRLWPMPAMLMVCPSLSAGESCEQLKCVAVYRQSDPCQCFPGCETYGNCCSDFKAVCMSLENSKEEFRPANPQEVPTEAPTTPKPQAFAAPVHHFTAAAGPAEKVAEAAKVSCLKRAM
eukprot:s724_g34.t2